MTGLRPVRLGTHLACGGHARQGAAYTLNRGLSLRETGPFAPGLTGRHADEEPCRDELVKMLRGIDGRLDYIPESHGADDKRVDIVVRAGEQMILPIEIKGQWHRDLWTSADKQLDHLYVTDWRAKRGIYLVLWFGGATVLTKSPASIDLASSPEELCEALRATSSAANAGRVDVVVLDLTRPGLSSSCAPSASGATVLS